MSRNETQKTIAEWAGREIENRAPVQKGEQQ